MPLQDNLTVSVVIPVKDRKESLLRAVASVLKQSYPVKEVIVVDDGSTEELLTSLQHIYPDVIYLRNDTSKGAPFSRNRGWKKASSDLIAFLDSDDEFEPDCLSNKIKHITDWQLDSIVGSIKLDNGKTVRPVRYLPDPKLALRDNVLNNNLFDARSSTIVVRKVVLEKISFDEKLTKHQDWDLFINIDKQFKSGYTNDCDTIIHVSENDRISNNLKHDATLYFINKNRDNVSSDSLFLFVVKMLFRAQRMDDKTGASLYINVLSAGFTNLSFKYSILKALLIRGIVSAKFLHTLKKIIRK